MQKLEIKGGKKISGTIVISGSKNATLPILASTILTNKKVVIKNIPIVRDVETMVTLLKTLGSSVKLRKKEKIIEIINDNTLKTFAPYNLVKTMRASFYVLGPLIELLAILQSLSFTEITLANISSINLCLPKNIFLG